MYFYLPTARARRLVSQLCALVSVPLHFIRRSEKLSRKRSKAFKSDSLQPYIKLYKEGERKAVYGTYLRATVKPRTDHTITTNGITHHTHKVSPITGHRR